MFLGRENIKDFLGWIFFVPLFSFVSPVPGFAKEAGVLGLSTPSGGNGREESASLKSEDRFPLTPAPDAPHPAKVASTSAIVSVMPRIWPEGIQVLRSSEIVGMGNAHLQMSSGGSVLTGGQPGLGRDGGIVVSRAADIVGSPVYLRESVAGLSGIGSSPLASMRLTSGFGLRAHPLRGGLRVHSGVDLAAPYGTPIAATSSGTVSTAGWRGGYGLYVALDHGLGRQTRYAHLSRLNVKGGQRVDKGDIIGFVGSTGMSTGPHLHYELRVNGRAVNPLAGRGRGHK